MGNNFYNMTGKKSVMGRSERLERHLNLNGAFVEMVFKMAVMAEELEIRVKTNGKEALAGLTQLRRRLEQLKGQMQLGKWPQASLKLAHKQIHKTMAAVAKEQEKFQAKVQAVQHKSQAQVQTVLRKEQAQQVQAK